MNKFRYAMLGMGAAASLFAFSERSRLNLNEVHPDLQAVSECAIKETPVDFAVIDGMRTEEEHLRNVAYGKSWTLRSRHQDGKAIDYAAVIGGKITFIPEYYIPIAAAFNLCSQKLHIPIIWGGEWKQKDYGHIELDRRKYP